MYFPASSRITVQSHRNFATSYSSHAGTLLQSLVPLHPWELDLGAWVFWLFPELFLLLGSRLYDLQLANLGTGVSGCVDSGYSPGNVVTHSSRVQDADRISLQFHHAGTGLVDQFSFPCVLEAVVFRDLDQGVVTTVAGRCSFMPGLSLP